MVSQNRSGACGSQPGLQIRITQRVLNFTMPMHTPDPLHQALWRWDPGNSITRTTQVIPSTAEPENFRSGVTLYPGFPKTITTSICCSRSVIAFISSTCPGLDSINYVVTHCISHLIFLPTLKDKVQVLSPGMPMKSQDLERRHCWLKVAPFVND